MVATPVTAFFQQFGADRALFFQKAVISPLQIQTELRQTVVLAGLADCSRPTVPFLRTAKDAGRNEDALAVDGYTAKDGGRAVGLDSFPIDIGQNFESATHNGSFCFIYFIPASTTHKTSSRSLVASMKRSMSSNSFFGVTRA